MEIVTVIIIGYDRSGWAVESHFRSAISDEIGAACNIWLMNDTRLGEVRAYPVQLENGLGQSPEPVHVAKLPWIE